MPTPIPNEQEDEFISRCMGDEEAVNDFPDEAQRYAVCSSKWDESRMSAVSKYRKAFAEPQRISFDYDETLTKAKEIARRWIAKGAEVYIISARNEKSGMLKTAAELGIPASRVYATGSNKSKIEIVQKLKIDKHYDNNPDVIKQLGVHGQLVISQAESFTDYPEAATENAKIALRWVEENGWGSCGEATGKARASQLANREPISEDTIARMAAFERHRQNSDKELGDGCGRLMWLAWGGDEGIEWAQRKLKQIRDGKA
jgi:hypothetical protein